ncbi:ComF family protein [Oscillatoria sp. FACHB-1407]|uniref:ComF family protein n=1 Tax=Oscillatoria sp. FACHB-1407 TaxID=2692847 RepID=UPI0016837CCE|nr:ComF family protein [Oscillatoria sp. FACHB-1407]MBD2460010.1 ComF family protein [Oscillatoria sp. FACHB-1407]
MQRWTQSLKPLLGMFLQSVCPACQRSTPLELCLDCERQVKRCQLSEPGAGWHAPLPVFAWGEYGGALKRAIATLKYDNQPQLAQPMGRWLAHAWLASPLSQTAVTVVPIPMHAAKRHKRGFDQAELLAETFCGVTGLPLRRQGLERVRATDAQFGLSAAARQQNLAGAFQLGQEFRRYASKTPVLLLDDIYTTGATVNAAAQTLRRHQIRVYGVVAIAKPAFAGSRE